MSEISEIASSLFINQERLGSLLEDLGEEVVQRLFGVYRVEMIEKNKLITDYLEQKNFTALECECHALRSASINMGFDQIGDIMSEMEKAAMAFDYEKARMSFQQVAPFFAAVKSLDRLGGTPK
ncbi:MAG: hypothetical protein JKY45_02015 [Emcibacter sp.]|nr:hypothetical protein [Emcibacter sp.]